MKEYYAVVEITTGKGTETSKKVMSIETKAKSEGVARRLVAQGARDMLVDGESVELLGISRLKKGAPVNQAVLDFYPTVAITLGSSYGEQKEIALLPDVTWKDVDGKTNKTASAVVKKKPPPLQLPFTSLDMEKIADFGTVYEYDSMNNVR